MAATRKERKAKKEREKGRKTGRQEKKEFMMVSK